MNEIFVRPYDWRDFDTVVELWHHSKRTAFPYVAFQQGLTLEDDRDFFRYHISPRCDIWVAELGGRIAGFMALEGDYIDQLFIGVAQQRQGVGEALLRRARELSPTRLRLDTFQRNAPARKFYEKHGFTAVRFGISPPPENEPDVHYEWRPAQANS